MADVLPVKAIEVGDPVAGLVLMEARDPAYHRANATGALTPTPFAQYTVNPYSTCMTRALEPDR